MSEIINVPEIFGKNVFNDKAMQERLPKSVYKKLKKTIEDGAELDPSIADVVAHAMKDWAIERGATHYSHWFQPLTGITAEKHDAFISVPDSNGRVIMEFSGKELIKGEPDASSFPSGGLRSTFEARGYTTWDCTSPAFLREDTLGVTLYIPTAFCSYRGEALDKKTPLLRSMQAINEQALRILRLFGNTTSHRVIPYVGPEQEYFLVDKNKYLQRKDLIYTGRTLFGAMPPKGQEMDDHYFGSIRPRVGAFMKELNETLWRLGVSAKTQHNEVAPAQHELAPTYCQVNLAVDHNQMVMEAMKRVAGHHGLTCLLHEKPFDGINGSGKHNNWSISTDTGANLLEPGATPSQNAQFLLFLTAVIKAVDDYQELLRLSVASAGNDHRLGANEAPPAIMSVFLGDELSDVVDSIEKGVDYHDKEKTLMSIGATVLPHIPKDTTDRNRTSPFAFTGNKFEFRSLGSTASISGPNVILNTIVAESLSEFADELEKAEDFDSALDKLLRRELVAHKRIIFNGNGYSEEWVEEAERRGLSNLKSTVDALPVFIQDKTIELFTKNKVYTESEIRSRYEILLENYYKTINIEAMTLISMTKKDIMGAAIEYQYTLAEVFNAKQATGVAVTAKTEEKMLAKAASLTEALAERLDKLEADVDKVDESADALEIAKYYREVIFSDMSSLREVIDDLEVVIPSDIWPYPTYGEMLYSIK